MNVSQYYKENNSYIFNPIKQQSIIHTMTDKQLLSMYRDKLDAQSNKLFCKVNSPLNTSLYIKLLEVNINSRGI